MAVNGGPATTSRLPPSAKDGWSAGQLFQFLQSGPVIGLASVLLLFTALFGWRGELDRFFSPANLKVLVYNDIVTATAALGMLLIIISGGIDLSTGSVVALVTVTTMQVYRLAFAGPEAVLPASWTAGLRAWGLFWQGTHSPLAASLLAVPAGVLTGGLCGCCNGLVITRLGLAPFVATLGMLSIARGLAYWLSGRLTINFPLDGKPGWVESLAYYESDYVFFNPGFWLMLLLAAGVFVLLRYTILGRYTYAVGSNEATARLCGVNVERTKLAIYTLAGLLAGLAGVLQFANLRSGDPNSGKELELRIIAAAVIGGASLSGGQGTVTGTLVGVLILAILHNGVSNFNVPVEVQYIMIGAIIIVNTAFGRWQSREGS